MSEAARRRWLFGVGQWHVGWGRRGVYIDAKRMDLSLQAEANELARQIIRRLVNLKVKVEYKKVVGMNRERV